MIKAVSLIAACLLVMGCSGGGEPTAETPASSSQSAEGQRPQVPAPQPGGSQSAVVELRAVGTTFEGPREIPSGWTTFKWVNASNMTHFAIIDVPPAGVSAREMSDTVMAPFQDAMDAMNAGDAAAVDAAFATFPPWISEMARAGGPGFLSPGRVGQTTVYLAPGGYVVECYVKMDGVFHSTSPGEGQLGMVMDLTVTSATKGAAEPTPNVRLEVRNSGLKLVEGELAAGPNTVRVDFVEQQALPSFVGNDVHLIRVDNANTVAETSAWMDWRTPNGLQDPSPATFLGGINDLPAGSHGYFTVDLAPGNYALIAEMPDPLAHGFVLQFSVP